MPLPSVDPGRFAKSLIDIAIASSTCSSSPIVILPKEEIMLDC